MATFSLGKEWMGFKKRKKVKGKVSKGERRSEGAGKG